jgi:hypothetical protein
MTHLLAVRDVRRAGAVYAAVLGGRVVMEENPCIVEASYREWLVRGAHFLAAPLDRGAEVRCCMRDQDGDLVVVGPATGAVGCRLAEQAAAGREAGRADGR